LYRIKEVECIGLSVACIIRKEDWNENYKPQNQNEEVINVLKQNNVNINAIYRVRQEHTNQIKIIDSHHLTNSYKEENSIADGIITQIQGLALCISVADCVPIVLFDVVKKVLGLIHAGREGTRKKIVQVALNIFMEYFCSNPENIFCYIGPSIGPCCYYVSEELAKQCAKEGLVIKQERIIDLWQSNKIQMIGSGIKEEKIKISNICTCCNNEYYSYRRGDKDLRNYVVAMI